MDPLQRYLSERYWSEDPLLRDLRADTAQRAISIPIRAEAGRTLALVVRVLQASNVLEVGTLFGYSAIWMARELQPGGRLDTIESNLVHADAAEQWLGRAGLSDRVTVHRGEALDVLAMLPGPYDIVFLDADKEHYPDYTKLALERLRPGGILMADNAYRQGHVVEEGGSADVNGVRVMHDMLANDPSLMATTWPLGDGLAIALKIA